MLPLLIAAGIGLVAGAAANSGNTVTHNSSHKHVHLHVHKKSKGRKRRRRSRNQTSKQITTNLYNFSKNNALPPGERRAVHKEISVVKSNRLKKRKRARSRSPEPYRW